MADGKRISIKLTPEQQKELEKVTGKTGEAIELGVEELEERIAPSFLNVRIDSLADPRPSPVVGGGNWVIIR